MRVALPTSFCPHRSVQEARRHVEIGSASNAAVNRQRSESKRVDPSDGQPAAAAEALARRVLARPVAQRARNGEPDAPRRNAPLAAALVRRAAVARPDRRAAADHRYVGFDERRRARGAGRHRTRRCALLAFSVLPVFSAFFSAFFAASFTASFTALLGRAAADRPAPSTRRDDFRAPLPERQPGQAYDRSKPGFTLAEANGIRPLAPLFNATAPIITAKSRPASRSAGSRRASRTRRPAPA